MLVLGLLLAGVAQAQEVEEPFQFQEVIEVEGVSADDLYTRAREWSSGSSDLVLEIEEKSGGLLVGKGSIPYVPPPKQFIGSVDDHLLFSFRIEVKDGRVRVTLDCFTHQSSGMTLNGQLYPGSYGLLTNREVLPECVPYCLLPKYRKKVYADLKSFAQATASDLIERLHEALTNGQDSDW